MSFRHLLDHTADIVRPAPPNTGDSLGDEQEIYTAVYEGVRCAFWPLMAPIGDYGAGETPAGMTGGALEKVVVPKDRDIIVTRSGPEHPSRRRIVAHRSPGRRFGRSAHHREVECVPFEGDLIGYDTPAPGAGS